MIENVKQYHITRTQMFKFAIAINEFHISDRIIAGVSKKLAISELEALKSEYDVLFEQVLEFLKGKKEDGRI